MEYALFTSGPDEWVSSSPESISLLFGVLEMAGSRVTSLLSSLLFSAVTVCWTAAGETAVPQLATSELPADILNNDCADSPCADVDYRTNWVGHTSHGDLFVVGRSGCAPGRCTHWLVE